MGRSERKIGILGGSFDPVHIGHLILAEYAISELGLEKVIFIPNYLPPHKEEPLASASQRYAMVKLAIMDNSRLEISDIEIKRGGVSYTYDTLLKLRRKKSQKFYFILGSDAYSELETWKNYRKLTEWLYFVIATRPGARIKRLSGVKVHKLLIPEIELSSSYIRERVKSGFSIRYLVPEKVRDYIATYNLYR